MLQRVFATSHAQHLAVDAGIDHDALRRALDDLIEQRNRLRAVANACPPSREYEINALAQRRNEMAEQDAAARHELVAIRATRGWRHHRDRAARRVVLVSQTRDTATRLRQFDEAIEPLRREHDQHTSYMSEHHDELQLLPKVERAVEARIEQLVEADVNHPPGYLRDLGRISNDPERSARWRAAAHHVERARVERGITEAQRPFGPRPDGDRAAVWRAEVQQLALLTAAIDPPTRYLAPGMELT